MEIKKVLFTTDFSEGASHSLSYAADVAKTYGARLYLLHVIQDVTMSPGLHIPHGSVDITYKELEANAKKSLEKLFVSVCGEYKNSETGVMRGVPYEEILKFATEKGIDLIVIGTHGRKGLDRVLFGSTAERVVRNASCPVLTVRMPI
ncbi:MAG TPA: universal stress protein [Dissulfurispiraceae bacterium]|nr:universal stress protein [Dissulfurispiraceae bacterium]